MASDKNRTGLFVMVPIYFMFIGCCALFVHRRHRNLQDAGRPDRLSTHYLGGRVLGPLVTTGTVFASVYSGYAIVGVRNEAFRNGWMALRWIAATFAIFTGLAGTGLRLRKAALVRNHKTPIDFITDRFQSQVLRYTVLLFTGFFGFDDNSAYAVVIIMGITLIFEWVGGLNCAALTDCIQCCIMIVASITLSIIIAGNLGGSRQLDPTNYPKPEFYRTPSWESQFDFWQFAIRSCYFFSLPHLMQRTYAAKDLFSLKCAYTTLTCGTWLLLLLGVAMGTVGVQFLSDEGIEDVQSPYTSILEEVMELQGFPEFIANIAVVGSLAAIMSTADSLLIAISQLVTEEVVYPLFPDASPTHMASVGRLVSLGTALIASSLGLSWDKGMTDLRTVNSHLAFQIVPIFLLGLFTAKNMSDLHPWCISLGAIVSSMYVIAMSFGYIGMMDNHNASISAFTGLIGVILQLTISGLLECGRRQFLSKNEFHCEDDERDLIFPLRPDWDIPKRTRFGIHALTPNLLHKMMVGVNEPFTNIWFTSFLFFAISLMTPIVSPGFPKNIEDVVIVGGLPWWAFKILLMGILPTVMLLVAFYRMPSKYPNNDDPDVLELTPEELGHRHVYDQPNELATQRRREILKGLGMLPEEINAIFDTTIRHLSSNDSEF